MQKKLIVLSLLGSILTIQGILGADGKKFIRISQGPTGNVDDGRVIIKGFTPTHKAPLSKITTPISDQILKEEIQTCTLPVIRQRIENWTQYMQPSNIGHPCRAMIYLTIKRRFEPSSTDDLSKAIFAKVSKIESKTGFVSETSISPNNSDILTLATPQKIDQFTNYEKIKNPYGTYSIECTTQFLSKEYIEEIIAEMGEKN